MVVAKHQSALDALASQFQDRLTHKVYVAVVVGVPHPAAGRIETEIGRSRHDRKKMSTDTVCGRHAVSNYQVIEVLDRFSIVQLQIETGRTHQIRVQMAHIGHPVAGDLVYGGSHSKIWKDRGGCPRQMLHSQSLSFIHPSTHQRVEFSAPLPDDMVAFIRSL